MADWVSSLLAGLGAGAESLGTSMTERDKRTAAAKQRNMELSNEMAMKMAEFGMSPDVNLPTSAAVQGIGNLRMTTPDPITSFAKNLSIGQDTGKSLAPSPRFDVFSGTEAAPPIDLADPLQNHGKFKGLGPAVSRGPVSAYGAPTMPRTKLGLAAQVPNVQAEVNAPPMTTGAGDENLPRMSLIDPVTGESTRYKRDITQSLPYLQMQATTKANEERDAARQEAQGVREAAALALKNADTLREQARAKQEKNRSDYEYIRIVDGKNPIVQKAYNDLTSDQQNSLGQIADTVKERNKVQMTPYQSGMLNIAQQRLTQTENKPAREENATQLASRARVVAGIADMNTADAGMLPYETKLMNGTASIDGLNQITGRMANAFTHDDPFSQTLQSTALSILDRVNPELARYLRQGLTFAEGESMISQRPSDFRTKMAAFLSTAASGASKDLVLDIQHRRKNMLTRLNPLFPESGAAKGVSPTMMGTATSGQPFAAPPPTAPPVPSDPYKALPRRKP